MAVDSKTENEISILERSKEEGNEKRTKKLLHDLPEVMIDRILIYLIKCIKQIKEMWNYVSINSTFHDQFSGLTFPQKEPVTLNVNGNFLENINPIIKSKSMAAHVCRRGLEIIFQGLDFYADIEDAQSFKLQQLRPMMEKLRKLKWLQISNLKFDKQNIMNKIRKILEISFELQTILLQTGSSYDEEKVVAITQGCKAMQYTQIEKSSSGGTRKRKLNDELSNEFTSERSRKRKLDESTSEVSVIVESLNNQAVKSDWCSDNISQSEAIEAIPDEITKELEDCFGTKMMVIVHKCEANHVRRTQTHRQMRHAWSRFQHQRLRLPPVVKIVTKININEKSMEGVEDLIRKFTQENSNDDDKEQVILIKRV